MQDDIDQIFRAYLEETSAKAQKALGLNFLRRLLSYNENDGLPDKIIMHIADLWLDFFSVEIRMEKRAGDDDESWTSSRNREGPPSEVREIVTAREWLLRESRSSTANKEWATRCSFTMFTLRWQNLLLTLPIRILRIIFLARKVVKALIVEPKIVQ